MAYLTEEQRKEKIVHRCRFFTFESCADLSIGVKVTSNTSEEYKKHPHLVAADVASFTTWWNINFRGDLNGFPGMDTIKWEF